MSSEWGIPLDNIGADDPPVRISSADSPRVWNVEADSVSLFALQRFAYSLKFSSSLRWFAIAHVDGSIASIVADAYPELLQLRTWPTPIRFFGDRDTMVEIECMSMDSLSWLYAVTRTSAAANVFKSVVKDVYIQWHSTSDQWPRGWVNAAENRV